LRLGCRVGRRSSETHDPEGFVRAVIEYQRRSYVDAKAALNRSWQTVRPMPMPDALGNILWLRKRASRRRAISPALQADPDNLSPKGMNQTQTRNQR
jgi:hypothetical protein